MRDFDAEMNDQEEYMRDLAFNAHVLVDSAKRELEINHNVAFQDSLRIEWEMIQQIKEMLGVISQSLYEKSKSK